MHKNGAAKEKDAKGGGSANGGSASGANGFLKFGLGVVLGAAMAFGYVRWNLSLPKFLELPEKLKGNLISSAAEIDLYDLDKPLATRRRALEIFFSNRPAFAVEIDREYKHPFLAALYRKRATREARQLLLQWPAFDMALAKPALRAALARQYGTEDRQQLKQAMLMAGLRKKPFLAAFMARNGGRPKSRNLLERLKKLAPLP